MVDYELLYGKMFNAAQDAINILMKAQQECEELFMETAEDPTDSME